MDCVDLYVPTSWQELSQEQLHTVTALKCAMNADRARAYAFLALSGMRVLDPGNETHCIVSLGGKPYRVSRDTIAFGAEEMRFMDSPPAVPLRYDFVEDRPAPDAALHGYPFGRYIEADALFNAYLLRRGEDRELALKLVAALYGGVCVKGLEREEEYIYMTVQWWQGLKSYLATQFTHLFRPTGGEAPQPDELHELMLAQVRALTDGDVTKEEAVLNVDTWSALGELDAKAREAEELKRLRP